MIKPVLMGLARTVAIASPVVGQEATRVADIPTPDGPTLKATYFDPEL